MFLVILLKNQSNAGQCKQWDIPSASAAARLPNSPMTFPPHWYACEKQLIITSICRKTFAVIPLT